jgi:hypothetical protein
MDQIGGDLANLHHYIQEIKNPQNYFSCLITNDWPIYKIINPDINYRQE